MATRWMPDTCTCVVIYDADFNCTEVEATCEEHAHLTDPQEHYDAVLAKNQAKNIALIPEE